MKTMLTSLALISFCATTFAQNSFSNNTCSGLEKVIQDYPNRFKNIRGDMITENRQAIEYQSKIKIAGASSCMVTRYNFPKNDIYRWSCTLSNTDDFSAAEKKFQETFAQIENSIVSMHGGKPFILNGKYESPDQGKKSTSIIFELLPAVGETTKLIVDLSLQHEMNDWKISLSVYDRDYKNNEQDVVANQTNNK